MNLQQRGFAVAIAQLHRSRVRSIACLLTLDADVLISEMCELIAGRFECLPSLQGLTRYVYLRMLNANFTARSDKHHRNPDLVQWTFGGNGGAGRDLQAYADPWLSPISATLGNSAWLMTVPADHRHTSTSGTTSCGTALPM